MAFQAKCYEPLIIDLSLFSNFRLLLNKPFDLEANQNFRNGHFLKACRQQKISSQKSSAMVLQFINHLLLTTTTTITTATKYVFD